MPAGRPKANRQLAHCREAGLSCRECVRQAAANLVQISADFDSGLARQIFFPHLSRTGMRLHGHRVRPVHPPPGGRTAGGGGPAARCRPGIPVAGRGGLKSFVSLSPAGSFQTPAAQCVKGFRFFLNSSRLGNIILLTVTSLLRELAATERLKGVNSE